ncbi:MAG TPA: sensor domain-containing diguanylate cyclase [Syntrophales bacterium]|nr:sensor domain-containing diguanylate cyclase [Syntrophales bacterium]
MSKLKEIIETLNQNQDIAQKFFEIETSVLSILNFKDFLERLLTEIQEKMEIPYVWVSLIDGSDFADMLQKSATSEILKRRTNLIERDLFLRVINNSVEPILANYGLAAFRALLPCDHNYLIQSLAVAPLTLDGGIVGSLNQADSSSFRYRPDMDTTLLKRLATIVSICLSNVMAHERLDFLASRDPLTGLLNRRVLEQIITREFDRALRYRTPLTVVFLDVDGFKTVNDTYGHDAGDEVLKYVAAQLQSMSRASDIVARFAGDEFVIILPNTPPDEASEFATRLQTFFLNHHLMVSGAPLRVSVSFGLSHMEDGAYDAMSLLKRADKMLYSAKQEKNTRYSYL